MTAVNKPVTERPDPTTESFDVSSILQMINHLATSNKQIFDGYESMTSLPSLTADISKLAIHINSILHNNKTCGNTETVVVLSGSGTSGRLAFVTARTFNMILRKKGQPECFRYLMAGGDAALIEAKEAFEDDGRKGVEDLQKVMEDAGARRLFLFAISAGLSAAYTAAQLDFCLQQQDRCGACLIGFNEIFMARQVPLPHLQGRTFKDIAESVLERANASGRGFWVLCSVVGPEAITGSTRLKAGSCTKIILDCCLSVAMQDDFLKSEDAETSVKGALFKYKAVMEGVYSSSVAGPLSKATELVIQARSRGASVHYIGAPPFGLYGIIDSSECPPTFGAHATDFHGFILGGWSALGNTEGDLFSQGKSDKTIDPVSLLKSASSDDCVILLDSTSYDSTTRKLLHSLFKRIVEERQCASVSVLIQGFQCGKDVEMQISEGCNASVHFRIAGEENHAGVYSLEEIALKLILNALSTCAHAKLGKIYRNLMVDVGVRNAKLFIRAVGIVEKVTGIDSDGSTRCLLRSIYRIDAQDEIERCAKKTIEDHVAAAARRKRVVPVAIMLARDANLSVHQCHQMLEKTAILRLALPEATT